MILPESHPVRIEAEEKRAKAMHLRLQGASYRQIAQALSCSVARAWQLVDEAYTELKNETKETATVVREMELARLDGLYMKLATREDATTPRVIDSQLRIMERRAKLLGLDAPQQIVGADNGPIQIAAVDAREILLARVNEMAERLAARAIPAAAQEITPPSA